MRAILASMLAMLCITVASAQVEKTINVPYTSSSSPTYQALLYLPSDYSTSSKSYPLLVFCHGTGEAADGGTAGTGLAKIYNSSGSGGPAYFIEHGGWPSSFKNPVTGAQEQFIVVSPQAGDWDMAGDQLNYVVNYLVNTYRVDKNRIHLTGLSAGGMSVVEYVSQLDPAEDQPAGGNSDKRFYAAATIVPMSQASNDPTQAWGNIAVANGTQCWGFGDPINDVHGNMTEDYVSVINSAKSGFARFTTFNTGHGPWSPFYNPAYTENFTWKGVTASYSIYTWMLANPLNGATQAPPPPANPVANAGAAQTITLPTSTVTLSGSASTGTISSYSWTKQSGPSGGTIASPSSATTTVTGLAQGTYVFKLTLNGGSTSTVQVTVNAAPVTPPANPVANAGAAQTVTLPTSTVTLSGNASTGTISSYSWTKQSGPSGGTIASPSSATTSVTGLAQGTYVFKLTLNGGSSSTVQVTVNAAPVSPPPVTPPANSGACKGTRKYITPDPGDSSIWIDYGTPTSVLTFKPGDTIAFKSSVGYGQVEIHGLTGTAACPIVVTNEGGQAHIKGFFKFYGAKYVHVDGSGHAGTQYGFLIQDDPNSIVGDFRNGVGLQISERSKVVEINNVFVNHTVFGMVIKQSPDCPDSLDYPNWIMDSVYIHDNLIRQVGLEGMYIGDTSPDNSPTNSDPRVVTCTAGVIYPRPIRSGHMRIYNNIIDSTERGGIQLSGHSDSVALIYGNTVSHTGMDGDEQQGTGISIGLYTRAYIHDNIIKNTTTWGIASLGGSGTGVPLRIENNTLDSIGYGNHYNNVTDVVFPITPKTTVYGPMSGTPAGNDYTFAVPIFVKTVTNMDHDSTQFWIKGNKIGSWLAEARKTFPSDSSAIQVYDYAATPMFQKQGNIVCGNTRLDGVTPASYYIDAGIKYSASCTITTPTASAGNNQTITLPASSVTLSGTGVAGSGHTIRTYGWTKVSGGAATITSASSAGTTVTGLVQGGYVFRLTVTQDDGQTATSDVTITVNGTTVNQSPTANAGSNLTITLPVNTATLIGSGSDPDGTVAGYQWVQVSGPSASSIVTAGQATTIVNNLVQGVYTYKLTVTDNKGATGTATVTVTVNAQVVVTPPPGQPVANAGSNQVITLPANQVTLDGSASKGTITSYKWTKKSGPSSGRITSSSSAKTTVTSLVQGIYVFQLTLNGSVSATVQVTVNAASSVTPPVTPPVVSGSKFIEVRLYGGDNPYNTSEWNNWNVDDLVTSNTLNYTDGTPSGVTAKLSINESVVDNSSTYGGTMAPPEVLRYTSFSDVARTLTLYGLKTNATYSIDLYASRNTNSGNNTVFSAGGSTISVATYDNMTNKASFSSLQSNSQGQLTINITTPNSYNYLNGFVITETSGTSSAEVTTVPAAATAAPISSLDLDSTEAKTPSYTVYPNPVRDHFLLEINNSYTGSVQVNVIDQLGAIRRSLQTRKDQQSTTITVPAGDLAPGVYFITVQMGGKRITRKILKL